MSDDLFTRIQSFPMPASQVALWYLGGAGYVLKTATTTLLIDPFISPGNSPAWKRATPPAFTPGQVRDIDGVFVTHEHDDHADPMALTAIALRTEAHVVGPKSCIPIIKQAGVPRARYQLLPPHAAILLDDLRVTAVPMSDPNAKSCNGYVFQAQGITILHCGDSHFFEGFAELARRWSFDAICVSVAYNPPGKNYYMDEAGAARAARDAKAKLLIVQHYDLWQGYILDPQRVATVASWYCPETRVVAATMGEPLIIG